MSNGEGAALLVLENFHRFLQSPEIVQALIHQIIAGKQNRTFIVILSPVVHYVAKTVMWRPLSTCPFLNSLARWNAT